MRWQRQQQRRVGAVSLSLLVLVAHPAWGECRRAEITLAEPQGGDQLGVGLATAGDMLFASAPGHAVGDGEGVVCWYERTDQWDWQLRGLIRPVLAEAHVGSALAATEDKLIIGSYQTSTVHVLQRQADAWVEMQVLEPVDADDYSQFGLALALADGVLVVSAPRDQGLLDGGALYVYESADDGPWELRCKYLPDAHNQPLGRTVATDGEVIAASAGGALHVLERDADLGWQPAAVVFPPQMHSRAPLAAANGQVLVGTAGYDGAQDSQGAVQVYQREPAGDWALVEILGLPDPQPDEDLGATLSLRGERLFVLAGGNEPFLPPTVHLFERTGDDWGYVGQGDSGDSVDDYGYALAVTGDTLFVSEPAGGDDDSGVVQVHAYSGDADGDDLLDACYLPGDLNADGVVDGADVQLVVDNYGLLCPPNQCLPTELELPIDIYEGYGFDVALLGDSLFVHERGDVSRHDQYMRVHRFERSGQDWGYQQTFGIYDWGWSMDASESFVAVGGVGGEVYVIREVDGAWADVQIAPDVYPELHFVIAATGDTIASFYDESVRIYQRGGQGQWSETQDFEIGVGLSWSERGAGDGDLICAASYGEVVILERGTDGLWALSQVVPIDFGELRDIAIDGERILVGAPRDHTNPPNEGAAYLVEKTRDGDWVQTRRIELEGNTDDIRFGQSVALCGNIALISALHAPSGGYSRRGAVHLYDSRSWEHLLVLTPYDLPGVSYYGFSLSLEGSTAAIGALDGWGGYMFDGGQAVAQPIPRDADGAYQPGLCDCPGDADGDADVDQSDLGVVLANFGRELE